MKCSWAPAEESKAGDGKDGKQDEIAVPKEFETLLEEPVEAGTVTTVVRSMTGMRCIPLYPRPPQLPGQSGGGFTWLKMKALAESDGSRLPRNHEVQAFVDGAPVRGCEGVDAWTPTTGWDGQDHTWPDWVQIGSGPHHHPGKCHVHDCGGYPAWGAEEAQRPWQRMLLVVRGDQDAAGAEVLRPSGGIALSPDGKQLFFADVSCKIRVVNLADGAVSTLAGSGIRQSEDGVGLGASFAEAKGLALSPDGKQLFVADWGGNKIRVVNVADGTMTTLAGSGEGKSEDGVKYTLKRNHKKHDDELIGN